MKELFEKLAELLPYKWRVQSFSKNKPSASCVAYIDSRDVMRRLDEVLGPENWQKDFKEIKGNMFCGIGIYVYEPDFPGRWIWKWDCGTESNTEKEKGEASDSFKRAAVNWGIGRFLYDLPIQYVDANDKKTGNNYPYPVDKQGKRIYDLTKHINGSMPKKEAPNKTKVQPAPPKQEEKAASVKQKTELTLLLNNELITTEEKQAMFKKMDTLSEGMAEAKIKSVKKAIADRTKTPVKS